VIEIGFPPAMSLAKTRNTPRRLSRRRPSFHFARAEPGFRLALDLASSGCDESRALDQRQASGE